MQQHRLHRSCHCVYSCYVVQVMWMCCIRATWSVRHCTLVPHAAPTTVSLPVYALPAVWHAMMVTSLRSCIQRGISVVIAETASTLEWWRASCVPTKKRWMTTSTTTISEDCTVLAVDRIRTWMTHWTTWCCNASSVKIGFMEDILVLRLYQMMKTSMKWFVTNALNAVLSSASMLTIFLVTSEFAVFVVQITLMWYWDIFDLS